MSWTALLTLAGASYGLKALGPLLLRHGELRGRAVEVLQLLPIPLLAALIVVQTLGDGRQVILDARVPALAVAAVLVWRRAPFLLVVLASAATAAAVRAV